MSVFSSYKDKHKKYFFEGFKIFTKESIEKGRANPEVVGKLMGTLEASITDPNYKENKKLMSILDDCIEPFFLQSQERLLSYLGSLNVPLKSLGYAENDNPDTIYIHTVEELKKS